ncbi:unnamed protein product [Camellia sinensis]
MQHQHQQLMHRNTNQGLRYVASTQNGMDPSIVPQGLMAPMMPLPFDVSGMSTTPLDVHHPGPVPMSTLASALASATPENQRMMLGEQLFPLVERVEPDPCWKSDRHVAGDGPNRGSPSYRGSRCFEEESFRGFGCPPFSIIGTQCW